MGWPVMKFIGWMLSVLLAGLATAVAAEADGPDFFAVTGVTVDDVLNIRVEPTAASRKIGEIPHDGRQVRNLGCQGVPSFAEWERMTESERKDSAMHRWCRISYQGTEGWVAGRYLREDSGP